MRLELFTFMVCLGTLLPLYVHLITCVITRLHRFCFFNACLSHTSLTGNLVRRARLGLDSLSVLWPTILSDKIVGHGVRLVKQSDLI